MNYRHDGLLSHNIECITSKTSSEIFNDVMVDWNLNTSIFVISYIKNTFSHSTELHLSGF